MRRGLLYLVIVLSWNIYCIPAKYLALSWVLKLKKNQTSPALREFPDQNK